MRLLRSRRDDALAVLDAAETGRTLESLFRNREINVLSGRHNFLSEDAETRSSGFRTTKMMYRTK